MLQSGEWRQPIAHDHVGFLDRLQPADGEQSSVSGAPPTKITVPTPAGCFIVTREGNGWHTMIRGYRRNQLVTLRDTSGRYNQSTVTEIITLSRPAMHDQ